MSKLDRELEQNINNKFWKEKEIREEKRKIIGHTAQIMSNKRKHLAYCWLLTEIAENEDENNNS